MWYTRLTPIPHCTHGQGSHELLRVVQPVLFIHHQPPLLLGGGEEEVPECLLSGNAHPVVQDKVVLPTILSRKDRRSEAVNALSGYTRTPYQHNVTSYGWEPVLLRQNATGKHAHTYVHMHARMHKCTHTHTRRRHHTISIHLPLRAKLKLRDKPKAD